MDIDLAANLEPDRVEIRLFDRNEQAMPGAPWQLDWGDGTSVHGVADNDGWVRIIVNQCVPNCTLQWGKSESDDDQDGDYLYWLKMSLGCSVVTDAQERQKQMLNNMGYPVARSLDTAVRAFQQRYSMTVTGLVSDAIPADTGTAIEGKYEDFRKDSKG